LRRKNACTNQNKPMQFEQAYLFLIKKLEAELPAFLTYHNVQHTKDVVEASQYLAKKENITDREALLLFTAAAYHDAGFITSYQGHEEVSCKMVETYLPCFNYSSADIAEICHLIMATKTPQQPKNRLEEILCDADLLYLGTDNYDAIAEKLFLELKEKGIVKNRSEWNEKQSSFLKAHRFFTRTAVSEFGQKKTAHTNALSNSL